MVLPAIAGIARLVAAASPAAFKAIEATCRALEAEIGPVSAGDAAEAAVSNRGTRALGAVIALRAACETRKSITGRRKRK